MKYFSFSRMVLLIFIYTILLFPVTNSHYQAPHAHQPTYGDQQSLQHNNPNYGQPPAAGQNILNDRSRIHDKEHIKEHLGGIVNEPDLSKMSEEELQFHYFKMHDSDNNNMLDGSELIKSLIHWHGKLHNGGCSYFSAK